MNSSKLLVLATLCASLAHAQESRVYTDADYAQAEKFMPYNVNPLVFHTVDADHAGWLPDGRFWYRDGGPAGASFVLVDPAKASKAPAFEPAKLVAALSSVAGIKPADAQHLGVQLLNLSNGDKTVELVAAGRRLSCDLSGAGTCTQRLVPPVPAKPHPEGVLSPDQKSLAFLRDWNLWTQDVATGKETQLTRDGVKDFGYATDNAGWIRSDRPILIWSPDSRRIATFQQDQRKTGEMYLTNVTNGHPSLITLKYPLVGDADVTVIERVIVDVDAKKVVRLKMPPDQHRSTLCDDVACHGTWDDVQWSPDSKSLAFVSTSRDHRQEWMRIAEVKSGNVREVMNESAPKFFESGSGAVNWRYLTASNELLWFSERDNWGQLYLYDLSTGQMKNQITHGEGNVTQVLSVDEKNRTIYFLGVGRQAGVDPYFAQLYRVGFDGQHEELLTPEHADHAVMADGPAGSLQYFVDVFSTPTEPQQTVLRDRSGKIMMALTHQDITRLQASGWIPPVPIMVKARDGETDLYGLLFRPTNFDTAKRYPIVNRVYPGPQTGSCGTRSFLPARWDMQPLAELGFIVVCIDGMGTPGRSKSFHTAYYGDLGDNTIPDQIAGMKELAERYPWIDLDRAGIYGHSGGGNATAAAMFHFPDFFKAGIAESGNHDNRNYEDDWAEKWTGLLVKNADGTSNYDSQANQSAAKNLKGHLLLAHGTMDDNVPPSNTLLVADALIKANKDFDLLLIPNAHHGYGEAATYMARRRWDYFLRYVSGDAPPHEYRMKPYAETLEGIAGP